MFFSETLLDKAPQMEGDHLFFRKDLLPQSLLSDLSAEMFLAENTLSSHVCLSWPFKSLNFLFNKFPCNFHLKICSSLNLFHLNRFHPKAPGLLRIVIPTNPRRLHWNCLGSAVGVDAYGPSTTSRDPQDLGGRKVQGEIGSLLSIESTHQQNPVMFR